MESPNLSGADAGSAPPPTTDPPPRATRPAPARRQPKGLEVKVLPAPRPATEHQALPAQSFRALYCELNGIGRNAFARNIFFRCLKWWVLPLVTLQYVCYSRALENDFRLISEVAETTTHREFMGALETFTYRNRESGFFREVLRIRMSAKLLMKFGSKLLRHTDRETMHAEQDVYASVRPSGQPQRVPRRSARRF